MKINRIIVAASIIIILFGGIFLSQALGIWKTKNSGSGKGSGGGHENEVGYSQEKTIEEHTEDANDKDSHSEDYGLEEEHTEGEIVGSSTIRDALDLGISKESIIEIVGEYDNEDMLIKDLATENGLSFGKVKTALNELIE
jgi:hypothetical protein